MSTLYTVDWPELETRLRARMKSAPHGTKGDIAAALEITPTHLSQLISGKRNFTRELAEKALRHYGLELDYAPKGGDL